MILRKGDRLELRKQAKGGDAYFFATVVQVTDIHVTLDLGNYRETFHRQDFGKSLFIVDRKEKEE